MKNLLTAREKKFCQEIAKGTQPADAYRLAKFPLNDNNEISASALGELLINPNAIEYIQQLVKEKDTTFGITKKQQLFCEDYVSSGFKSAGGSYQKIFAPKNENVARVEASKLLKNLNIKKYIEKLSEEIKQAALIKAEDVITECKLIAYADIRDAIDVVNGEIYIKNIDALPADVSKTISEVSSINNKMGRSCKIKLHDKLKALEMLARFSGLSSDLNEAIASFRRYGYEVEQTETGYSMIDSFHNKVSDNE